MNNPTLPVDPPDSTSHPAPAADASSISEFDVSVIVPTFREAENLPILVPRVHEALQKAGLQAEIIVVDDNSQDGTIEACAELAKQHPVRLETRTEERGLSTAVIHGMRLTTGKLLICMDADLSHPPEKLPDLVAALQKPGVDFVIGSRYVPGASTDENWGFFRWVNSKVATLLARPLTRTSDPMAGFFGLSRESFLQAEHLDPVGYKIGLELLVKCGCKEVEEVPIHFSDRLHGESKLSVKEQLNYLVHLKRLMEYRYENVMYAMKFGAVGVSGMVVDLLCYAALLMVFPAGSARALAIWCAMTWNFILNRWFTFTESKPRPIPLQYVLFCLSCLVGAVVNWGVSVGLPRYSLFFADRELLAAMAGILAGFGFNFLLCRFLVFTTEKPVTSEAEISGDGQRIS